MDCGEIVIEADEWPAFLYNEEKYNPKKEWIGLFLGETFVRVSPFCPSSLPLLTVSQGLYMHIDWPFGSSGVALWHSILKDVCRFK